MGTHLRMKKVVQEQLAAKDAEPSQSTAKHKKLTDILAHSNLQNTA